MLEGKVATVINSRELALNIGSNFGVKENMIFKILAETPVEIKDPDTGEILDTIDREKVRVKVSEVNKKSSICKTFRVFHYRGLLSTSGSLVGAMTDRKEVETLKIDDSTKIPPLSEEESFVKTGDRAIQILNDE